MTVCLGDVHMTQHCKVLDTDAFDIVIGTDLLRCCLCNIPMPYTATLAVAFSLSLWSCHDEKNPVYATSTGLLELKTISPGVPSRKTDSPPCR